MADLDPAVEAAIRAIVGRAADRLPQLAASIADEYAEQFDEYARLQPEAKDQTVQSAFANLRALVRELMPESIDLPAFDPAAFERIGAVRMRMGISIDTLMRSFNVWGQRAWSFFRAEADLEDPREVAAFLSISQQIFRHVERATASMAKGYMREASSSWSDRELTRLALLEALVTGRIDPEQATHAGSRNLASGYAAIVTIRRVEHQGLRPTHDVVKECSRLMGHSVAGARALVGMHNGEMFVLWPNDAFAHAGEALAQLARTFPELAIGVGSPSDDLRGVGRSYEEAREAAAIAEALGLAAPTSFDDVRLERAVLGSAQLRDLGHRVLAPLEEYERRRGAELIATLRAYVESGCNVAEAGKRVFVHPNTVVYRLKRVAEVSGHDPREARGLLTLSLALLTSRLGRTLSD